MIYICMYVCMYVFDCLWENNTKKSCLCKPIQKIRMQKNAWAELRGPNTRMLKVCFGRLKPNLKQTELQKSKNRGKKGRIIHENKKTEKHKKQRLATLKRLKRGDYNEFERNLRLEKVVSRKVLKLAVETEEDRRARWRMIQLPHDFGWPWRRKKKAKQDWRRW